MEQEFRKHMRQMTLEQLQSPEGVKNHMDAFHEVMVSKGFANHEQIGAVTDVQEVIAKFLAREPPVTVCAAEMKTLADSNRLYYESQIIAEIMEMVLDASLIGVSSAYVDFSRLKSCPQPRLDHATPLFPLRGIEQRLQALGYSIMRVNAILIHIKWDGAIDLAVDHLHVGAAPRPLAAAPAAAPEIPR